MEHIPASKVKVLMRASVKDQACSHDTQGVQYTTTTLLTSKLAAVGSDSADMGPECIQSNWQHCE